MKRHLTLAAILTALIGCKPLQRQEAESSPQTIPLPSANTLVPTVNELPPGVRSMGDYRHVALSNDSYTPLAVGFAHAFDTTDGCNTFGAHGNTLKLKSDRMYVPYIADIRISGTRLPCRNLTRPRRVNVWEQTVLNPHFNGSKFDLFYPAEFALSAVNADDSRQSDDHWKRVQIDRKARAVTVTFTRTIRSSGDCQAYGLDTEVMGADWGAAGQARLHQPYFFDMKVATQRSDCRTDTERTVQLQYSETFHRNSLDGVHLDLMFPAEFSLSIL